MIKATLMRSNEVMSEHFIPSEALNIKYTIEFKDGYCLLYVNNLLPEFIPIVFEEGEQFTISLITQ